MLITNRVIQTAAVDLHGVCQITKGGAVIALFSQKTFIAFWIASFSLNSTALAMFIIYDSKGKRKKF